MMVLSAKSVTAPKRVMPIFFPLQAAQIANIGTNNQGSGKAPSRYLDDTAAAQHVGDDGRTAKAGDIASRKASTER